jgi:hypothetical protein
MNHEKFKLVIAETFDTINQLTASKGVEYSNSDDQLANFKRLGLELGLSPEAVNLVYLTKHLDSIKNFVRKGGIQPSSEPIQGRIDDAILYLILLKSLIIEGEQATEKSNLSEVASSMVKTMLTAAGYPSDFLELGQGTLTKSTGEECDCPICKPEAYPEGYLPVIQVEMVKVGDLSVSEINFGAVPNFLKKDPNDTTH